jgi:hypothetical protein
LRHVHKKETRETGRGGDRKLTFIATGREEKEASDLIGIRFQGKGEISEKKKEK